MSADEAYEMDEDVKAFDAANAADDGTRYSLDDVEKELGADE